MFKPLNCALRCSKIIFQEGFHNSAVHFQEIQAQNIIKSGWEDKMKFWLKKYEDLFGITKLSEMHERVLEAQKSIQIIQEKRRNVQEDIFVAQKKLQEMQEILHKTSMGDNMYISVVTQVHELLKDQKRLKETFSLYDQTEREQQTTLALAINNSQDHERTYREKNKYLSLITGVVGGLLGILGSSINNWRHRKDIKVFAGDISNQVNDLQKYVKKLNSVITSKGIVSNETEFDESGKLLSEIKVQQESFQENIRVLQSLLHNISPNPESYSEFYVDLQLKNISNQLEDKLNYKLSHHTSLNIGLIGSLVVLCTFVLYLTNSH